MDTDVLHLIATIFLPLFIRVNMRGSALILIPLLLGATFSGCFGIIETSNNTNFENSTISENMETIPCNGLIILCHRTYDQVTFPETHNSYSTHEDNIYYPASNHQTGFQAQWNAGVRSFMLDTHYLTNTDQSASNVRFCHGDSDRGFSPCTYGAVDPWNWLSALESEMNSEDRDIVTLQLKIMLSLTISRIYSMM